MLNIGDRVKTGNAKYFSDLSNSLYSGKTGTITDRYYTLTGAVNYEVTLDSPVEYLGYHISAVDYMDIDDALEGIE